MSELPESAVEGNPGELGGGNTRTEIPEEIVFLEDMRGLPRPHYGSPVAPVNRSICYGFCICKDLLRVYSLVIYKKKDRVFEPRSIDIGYAINKQTVSMSTQPRLKVNLRTGEVTAVRLDFYGI
jgi:hypothetical protein